MRHRTFDAGPRAARRAPVRARPGGPSRWPLAGVADVEVAAVEVHLVPGAVGEVRDQGEAVAADEGVPPLYGPVTGIAEPVDGECAHRPGEAKQPLLGPAGDDSPDMLVPARQ